VVFFDSFSDEEAEDLRDTLSINENALGTIQEFDVRNEHILFLSTNLG
jgi:hypothetical protein